MKNILLFVILLLPLFATSQITASIFQSFAGDRDNVGTDIEGAYYLEHDNQRVYGFAGLDVNDVVLSRPKFGAGIMYTLFPESEVLMPYHDIAIYYDGDVEMRVGMNVRYKDIPGSAGIYWDSNFSAASLRLSYDFDLKNNKNENIPAQ